MSLRCVVSCLMLLLVFSAASLAADEARDIQIRVELDAKNVLSRLQHMGLDIVYKGADYVEAIVNKEELAETQKEFTVKVVHESTSAFYRSRFDQTKTMGGYPTLAEINAYVDSLIAGHPDIVSNKISIGTTWQGRDMWAVKISDNPNVDEDEPEVLFTAAIHAREVITPLTLRNYAEHMTNSYGIDPEVTDLVNNREIWLIFCVNPDGYYYNQTTDPNGGGMWRKNRRSNGGSFGVDLNRNYAVGWGVDDEGSSPDPTDDTYRGPSPFSEPETQHMRDFISAHNFVITLYLHSYSNLVLYPWGYKYGVTPDDDIFSSLGDSCAQWNGYDPGPASGLYLANGVTDDWGYGEQTTKNMNFAFTIEIGGTGDGFWPSTSRIPQLIGENLQPIIFLTRVADHVYRVRPPMAPVINLPPTVNANQYTVEWTHDDQNNPATMFELDEMETPTIGTNPAASMEGWTSEGFSLSTVHAQSAPTAYFSGSGDSFIHTMTATTPYLVQTGDTLRFWTWYDIEDDYDYGYVEVSTDGVNFTPIPGNITTNANPHGNNRGNGITYNSSGTQGLFSLAAYVGQEVTFRFSYETDVSLTQPGWWIDDIYPYQTYETITVVSSSLTENSYTFYGKPGGEYYYRVRALDAEGQWGGYSAAALTNVVESFNADLDLDGVSHSVADLSLYALYLAKGISVFTVDQEQQIAQADVNCDGIALSGADADRLRDVILGLEQPCTPPEKAAAPGDNKLDVKTPDYGVRLSGVSLHGGTTAWVDVILDGGSDPLLGYVFKIEYDNTRLTLLDVRIGDDFSNWDYFGWHDTADGAHNFVTLAGVAWWGGDTLTAEQTDPLPSPKTLARLHFQIVDTENPFTSGINFVWEGCGDNTIASGVWPGPSVQVLTLSDQVFDADLNNITGLDPLYGGRASHCDNGYVGTTPAAGIDFVSGRISFDPSCCIGHAGNVDCDPDDMVSLGDLTALIDNLFVSLAPVCCADEAYLDEDPALSLGDLTALIDILFISLAEPPMCH